MKKKNDLRRKTKHFISFVNFVSLSPHISLISYRMGGWCVCHVTENGFVIKGSSLPIHICRRFRLALYSRGGSWLLLFHLIWLLLVLVLLLLPFFSARKSWSEYNLRRLDRGRGLVLDNVLFSGGMERSALWLVEREKKRKKKEEPVGKYMTGKKLQSNGWGEWIYTKEGLRSLPHMAQCSSNKRGPSHTGLRVFACTGHACNTIVSRSVTE